MLGQRQEERERVREREGGGDEKEITPNGKKVFFFFNFHANPWPVIAGGRTESVFSFSLSFETGWLRQPDLPAVFASFVFRFGWL